MSIPALDLTDSINAMFDFAFSLIPALFTVYIYPIGLIIAMGFLGTLFAVFTGLFKRK